MPPRFGTWCTLQDAHETRITHKDLLLGQCRPCPTPATVNALGSLLLLINHRQRSASTPQVPARRSPPCPPACHTPTPLTLPTGIRVCVPPRPPLPAASSAPPACAPPPLPSCTAPRTWAHALGAAVPRSAAISAAQHSTTARTSAPRAVPLPPLPPMPLQVRSRNVQGHSQAFRGQRQQTASPPPAPAPCRVACADPS